MSNFAAPMITTLALVVALLSSASARAAATGEDGLFPPPAKPVATSSVAAPASKGERIAGEIVGGLGGYAVSIGLGYAFMRATKPDPCVELCGLGLAAVFGVGSVGSSLVLGPLGVHLGSGSKGGGRAFLAGVGGGLVGGLAGGALIAGVASSSKLSSDAGIGLAMTAALGLDLAGTIIAHELVAGADEVSDPEDTLVAPVISPTKDGAALSLVGVF